MNRCKTCIFWIGKLKFKKYKECTNGKRTYITALSMDQYGIGPEYKADFLYTEPTFGCTEYKESL
jgi:hypothetical protein